MTFACAVYSKFPPSLHAPWLASTLLRCHSTNTSFTPLPKPVFLPAGLRAEQSSPPPQPRVDGRAHPHQRATESTKVPRKACRIHSDPDSAPSPRTSSEPAPDTTSDSASDPRSSGPFAPLVSEPGHPAIPCFRPVRSPSERSRPSLFPPDPVTPPQPRCTPIRSLSPSTPPRGSGVPGPTDVSTNTPLSTSPPRTSPRSRTPSPEDFASTRWSRCK
jgi:hypothetical protein